MGATDAEDLTQRCEEKRPDTEAGDDECHGEVDDLL